MNTTTNQALTHLLRELVTRGGSDLLLVADLPASIRYEGRVEQLGGPKLHGEDIENTVLPVLAEHAVQQYHQAGIADSSYRAAELGRFRINLHHERGRPAVAIRALPSKVPSLIELRTLVLFGEKARLECGAGAGGGTRTPTIFIAGT